MPLLHLVALIALFPGSGEVRFEFQSPDERRSPDELWQRGERLAAIGALQAELGAAAEPARRARLVRWQLDVHRYRAALADAAPCGAPCDALRGEAHYQLGEYEKALGLLALDDGLQLLWRVDALETLGRFAESDAALERARACLGKSDARVACADGRRLAREGRHAEAAERFQAALAIDPCEAEALYGLGRALLQSGEREAGLAALLRHRALLPLLDSWDFARRGVDLAPAHGPNWTALGDAERALGRFDRAEAAYARCADLVNGGGLASGEALVPNALRWARLLAEDRGKRDGAIELLASTAKRVDDARLWVRAGDLQLEAGRANDALAAFERARALRPTDAEIAKRIESARAAGGAR